MLLNSSRLLNLLHRILKTTLYGLSGAFLTLLVVFILYLNGRPDLNVWHVADLDEEFTAGSDVTSFEEYLALEDRLFRQLHDEVYDKISADQKNSINRFNSGSLSDPERWPQNWNRSYEMPVKEPRAGILMLHGMSDSPYSLRALAEGLHRSGAYVVGLRVPGHGTAPSALTRVRWQDMTAAVEIAVRHVADRAPGRPLHLVGYSNGGALAVHYVLTALTNPQLPQVESLALISPEIGLPKVAALAKWQARLGRLLGLEKLAWNSLMPEYDPYKYGSFAVNAGTVAHEMTVQIQKQIAALRKRGKLESVPPILAFSSVVDATVRAPALIEGLFDQIPAGGHELVLFDINRLPGIEPVLKWDPSSMYSAIQRNPGRSFVLGLVTNERPGSKSVKLRRREPGNEEEVDEALGLNWPDDVYSLSHVALPFPPDDPLYGARKQQDNVSLHLGALAFRGERDVLQVPASEMLRQRWNPFYPFLEDTVLGFFKLD